MADESEQATPKPELSPQEKLLKAGWLPSFEQGQWFHGRLHDYRGSDGSPTHLPGGVPVPESEALLIESQRR